MACSRLRFLARDEGKELSGYNSLADYLLRSLRDHFITFFLTSKPLGI